MKEIANQHLEGERALFDTHGAKIRMCMFDNGESPLKESSELDIEECIFGWKYPLWYCEGVRVSGSTLLETARSGIWYTKNISVKDSVIEAPKTFRRSSDISLFGVSMPKAQETLWSCENIELDSVSATGDYFAMNSKNVKALGLTLVGNYGFDGCENVEITDSKLISKDAFWNCKNVTVKNSVIIGEYLGWNSENVTLIDCTLQSLQGMCYVKNLVMRGCKVINTDLAFEYSSVDAELVSSPNSIKNPLPESRFVLGTEAELILDEKYTDPKKISVTLKEIK